MKERCNSLRHIRERKVIPLSRIREFQYFESNSKKKIQCQKKKVIFKKINSVSRIEKKSVLWVAFVLQINIFGET